MAEEGVMRSDSPWEESGNGGRIGVRVWVCGGGGVVGSSAWWELTMNNIICFVLVCLFEVPIIPVRVLELYRACVRAAFFEASQAAVSS